VGAFEGGQPLQRRFDVASLVARRDHDGERGTLAAGSDRSQEEDVDQREVAHQGQRRDEAVEQRADPEQREREVGGRPFSSDLEAGEPGDVHQDRARGEGGGHVALAQAQVVSEHEKPAQVRVVADGQHPRCPREPRLDLRQQLLDVEAVVEVPLQQHSGALLSLLGKVG